MFTTALCVNCNTFHCKGHFQKGKWFYESCRITEAGVCIRR